MTVQLLESPCTVQKEDDVRGLEAIKMRHHVTFKFERDVLIWGALVAQ